MSDTSDLLLLLLISTAFISCTQLQKLIFVVTLCCIYMRIGNKHRNSGVDSSRCTSDALASVEIANTRTRQYIVLSRFFFASFFFFFHFYSSFDFGEFHNSIIQCSRAITHHSQQQRSPDHSVVSIPSMPSHLFCFIGFDCARVLARDTRVEQIYRFRTIQCLVN